MTSMPIRVAVIGDVGGHVDELRRELRALGASETGVLPDDLVVIQVGDLVHRGPDSEAVVRLVNYYLNAYPGQWIQLVGNHEALYLRPNSFLWEDRIGYLEQRILKKWWADGKLHAAVAVETGDEDFLVTHAGVTEQFWREHLLAPGTARQAARRINSLARTGCPTLYGGGAMLGPSNPMAGPLWASRNDELVPGWEGTTLPFSQVHGHSGSHGESDHPTTTYDERLHHEETRFPGGRLIGVDPGHLAEATPLWGAFVVTTGSRPTVA